MSSGRTKSLGGLETRGESAMEWEVLPVNVYWVGEPREVDSGKCVHACVVVQ